MLPFIISLAYLPFSTESSLAVEAMLIEEATPRDRHDLVLEAHVVGTLPLDVPIIKAEYATFWPHVTTKLGQMAKLTPLGEGVYYGVFRHHGRSRDSSYPIMGFGTASRWPFGRYFLKRLYEMKPGQTYYVRGVYWNEADGRTVRMVSKSIRFVAPDDRP